MRVIIISFAGLLLIARFGGAQQPADLVIVNGKVYAADRTGKFQEAVALRGNKILQLGSTAEITRLRGPKTKVIDAHGGAVIPGFNDIHTHMLSGGMALDNVRLQGARTLDEVQDRIRSFAKAHPERAWIEGTGWNYGAFPGDLPTRAQLDAAVSDRPAVMRCYDGHSVWVNSAALSLAKITKDTPNPPNGFIVKDPKTGEPSGLIKESPAVALIQKAIPPVSSADRQRGLKAAIAEAQRNGVTSVTDAAGSPEDFEVYEEASRNGDLKVRVYCSLLVTPGFSPKDADRFDEVWRRYPDNPVLKTGIIKMFMDGVIETNTAFLLAPYTNIPSPGKPNYTIDDFDRIIQMMDRRGWQIMVHALGDGAVRMTLDGFERLPKVNPMPAHGRRDRVEHIETIDLADVPRFGKLGVIASMHPIGGFVPPDRPAPTGPQGVWATNVGPERAARGGMWKSISDAGGKVVFGSDWPVASLDAMGRIYNITHRAPRPGGTDQRLPLTTAIDDYTRESAYTTFDEKVKGTLAPGMLADVAILATDVFTHPATSREDLAVKVTIFDGNVVYESK
jgi:predicted amidohydrolase YtcJ